MVQVKPQNTSKTSEYKEIKSDMDEIKKEYPNAKVSYYFAKHKGGNYVIIAKENGETVYSSYEQ